MNKNIAKTNKKIRFIWTPGRCTIDGNEKAAVENTFTVKHLLVYFRNHMDTRSILVIPDNIFEALAQFNIKSKINIFYFSNLLICITQSKKTYVLIHV